MRSPAFGWLSKYYAIYVSSSIPFKQLQLPHSDLELLIVECTLGHQLFTIGGFYRPPGTSAVVMDNLHSVISLLRPQNFANLVLLGDFNIDPDIPHSSQLSDSFNHLLTDFCLSQVVSEPTRTSRRSSSTIKHEVNPGVSSFRHHTLPGHSRFSVRYHYITGQTLESSI